MRNRANTRIYPACCTSAYCGNTSESCPTCECYPRLQEFKQWVADNNAKCVDPVWSPLVYTVQENCHD